MTPSGCLHSHSPGPSPHACILAGAYSLVTSLPLFSLLAILPTADRGIWLNPESDYVHPLLRNIWRLLISFCAKSRIQFKFWPLWPYTNGFHCSCNLHTHTLFRIPPQFTLSSPTARAPSLMSSSNWGAFTSFPVWIPFISSFGLTKTSTTVLSRSASRHSSLAPDVWGKISHLSALSMMLAVGFCRCPSSGWRSSLLFLVCWGLSSWKNVGFFSMLFLQLLR